MTPDSTEDLARMVGAGLSDPQIAAALNVSPRTVLRRRKAAGLASQWQPELEPCGTEAAYQRGDCGHCDRCKAAHAAYQLDYIARVQASTPSTERARLYWSAREDAILVDPDQGTLYQRARQLGRTYAAAKRRLDYLRSKAR